MPDIQNVTDQDFETQVLQSPLPVLVDFHATWCGPCKMMTPVIAKVAGALYGQVNVVKVDIDQAPNVVATYGIRSVPTLMVFRDGEKVASHTGRLSFEMICALLKLKGQ